MFFFFFLSSSCPAFSYFLNHFVSYLKSILYLCKLRIWTLLGNLIWNYELKRELILNLCVKRRTACVLPMSILHVYVHITQVKVDISSMVMIGMTKFRARISREEACRYTEEYVCECMDDWHIGCLLSTGKRGLHFCKLQLKLEVVLLSALAFDCLICIYLCPLALPKLQDNIITSYNWNVKVPLTGCYF